MAEWAGNDLLREPCRSAAVEMLAVLKRLPVEERMDALALTCKAAVESSSKSRPTMLTMGERWLDADVPVGPQTDAS